MLRWFVLFSLLQVPLLAQTIIPHNTDVSGVWSLSNSPYVLQGRVTVPEDSSLSIEPGVEIRLAAIPFQGQLYSYYYGNGLGILEVRGSLNAVGNENDSILFTREGNSGSWGAVILLGKSPAHSVLKYCVFRYGNGLRNVQIARNEDLSGALSFYEKTGIAEHNSFYDCTYDGICAMNTLYLRIQDNHILNFNQSGINIIDSEVQIRQSEIAYSTAPSGSRVNAGVRMYSSDVLIVNSIIHHLNSNGLYAWADRSQNQLRSYNNTFVQNKVGMRLLYPGNSTFINCIFAYNDLNFDPRAINVSFENCLTNSIEFDSRISLVANNINFSNPNFIDTAQGNYRLFGNSPAVNAGKANASNLGLDPNDFHNQPRIVGAKVDIGAVEHQPYFDINESALVKQGQVYPNPLKNELYLKLDVEKVQYLDWAIINASGQTIWEGRLLVMPQQASRLSLSTLSAGNYWLEVRDSSDAKQLFQIQVR
jgi:hypothetical protein